LFHSSEAVTTTHHCKNQCCLVVRSMDPQYAKY